MKDGETTLWRRLDLPGHEIASIFPEVDGWRLIGVALLVESGRSSRIEYDIWCDAQWKARRCVIRGQVGEQRVSLDVERSTSGVWSIGGAEMTALNGCDDIDLGFSPATHLSADRYLYESAGGAFRRELQVDAFGCVIDYPGLWHAEATSSLHFP